MPSMLGSMIRQLVFKPLPLPAKTRFNGQTAIVTGANVGLGLAAAEELAAHGLSRLILGVRSVVKGEEAKKKIASRSLSVQIEVWELDQESFESIQAFAARAEALERLDIILLNAGVKNMKFIRSRTGHKSNVQVNVLATALLALLLLRPLRRTAETSGSPSRITFTSSDVHFWTPFKEQGAPNILARLDEEDSFNTKVAMERYNTSKLVSLLWAREFSARVGDTQDVMINFVNPGLCSTLLHRSDSTPGMGLILKAFAWSAEQGGHTLVDAVAGHTDQQGAYLSEQKPMSPSKLVMSAEGLKIQKKLWDEIIALFTVEVPGFELDETLM